MSDAIYELDAAFIDEVDDSTRLLIAFVLEFLRYINCLFILELILIISSTKHMIYQEDQPNVILAEDNKTPSIIVNLP